MAQVIILAALLAGCATPSPAQVPRASTSEVLPASTSTAPLPTPTPTLISAPTGALTPTPTHAPTATPSPTPTASAVLVPTSTPTPLAWQTYRMDYHFGNAPTERLSGVWMPIPREWDGAGMRNVRLIEIYPEPTDLIQDEHGNQIAYWAVTDPSIPEYGVVFEADLALVDHWIDPSQVEGYDTGSDLYVRYTQPSSWIQSDHPEIAGQAQEIVAGETNPYRQAQMVHRWVTDNISTGDGTVDAITALRDRQANCSANHLYIALLRALGIPARLVSCLHPLPTGDQWPEGNLGFGEGSLGAHIYAEFFLPRYGWVQSDATHSGLKFVGTDYIRVLLAKGEDIDLGPNWHERPLGWIHLPHAWGVNAEPYAYLDVTRVDR